MNTFQKFSTALVVTFLFAANMAMAGVGTIVDINLENQTATAMDNSTKEIVRFEDIDPKSVKMKNGCVVDYFKPSEQQAKKGMTPMINKVLECPGK